MSQDVPLLARRYDELTLGERQTTRARTITETDIVMWCSLTGDWFWIHSDRERAEASSFGQRIAPGMMVWAFGAGLGVPPDSRTIVANYGAERVRFTKPVLIGDTIHLEIEVVAKNDKQPGQGVVDFRWDLINQRGETVCASVLRVLQGAG
ncbi:MAG: MaoC/PaaZ C-terminal domain-containing protein [Candidatus Baltobacteraceae bacterium]